MATKIPIGPYSAYAIAKKHGFEGTEEEWLASLTPSSVDTTLTAAGKPADAKAVGDALKEKADNAIASEAQNGLMSKEDKAKLNKVGSEGNWELLEKVTLTASTTSFERISNQGDNPYKIDLIGLKVLVTTSKSQSKANFQLIATTIDLDYVVGGGLVAVTASSSTTNPPTLANVRYMILPVHGHYLSLCGTSMGTNTVPINIAVGSNISGTTDVGHSLESVEVEDHHIGAFSIRCASSVGIKSGAVIEIWGIKA